MSEQLICNFYNYCNRHLCAFVGGIKNKNIKNKKLKNANDALLTKFHVSPSASHAALPTFNFKISAQMQPSPVIKMSS